MENTQIKKEKTKTPNRRTNQRIYDIAYIAMFTAIITVCAQIQIPTTVPFTLQTFGVFMASAMLGWKRGTLSVLLYVVLGTIGVPVFAGFSGGPAALFGVTGGYIIGFIFTALVVGLMSDKLGKKVWVLAVAMVLGLAICYAFGTAWFYFLWNNNPETVAAKGPMSIMGTLALCVVPYLLFDAVKIAVATALTNRLDKIVKL